MFWHFDIGGQLVRIPRAFETGVFFAALPEAMVDAWYRDDPEAVAKWFKHAEEVITPEITPLMLRVAKEQMHGFGGVVTFEIETDLDGAIRFIDATKIPYQAPSLGGVESLIELPVTMSFWDVPKAERAVLGISDSLVRLACGIESSEDLIADMEQALEEV